MNWIGIAEYSRVWDAASHTGRIDLWFERPPAAQSDRTLNGIPAQEFAALAAVLRSDPDHRVGFDTDSGMIGSGIDMP